MINVDFPIKYVHVPTNTPVSHVGLYINVGTRDENDNEYGVAHLIEHLLFKGTKKKSARKISLLFDYIGADVNAYTTKEETCIHVSFLSEYYPQMVKLLSDMLFNSVFPDKETDKEINVIKEEIASYYDSPSELIFDEFEDELFKGHSIGHNILGNNTSLNYFQKHKEVISNFYINKYLNTNIIVWSSGNISDIKFHNLYNKYFKISALQNGNNKRIPPEPVPVFNHSKKRHDTQCYSIIGGRCYSLHDQKRTAFALIMNYLGGNAITSRINYILREKLALVYNIEASCVFYQDTGVFNIFFESDYKNYEKITSLIYKELKYIKDHGISENLLRVAKKQLKGNIAIASDSNLTNAVTLAKSLAVYGEIESIEDTFRKIELISKNDIFEAAEEVFQEGKISQLTYYPHR